MQTAHTRDILQRLPRLAVRAARIGLCLLLAAQCALIAIILVRGELPVPQFLLESLRNKFARAGYTVQWKDIHINLTGQILVQDLEVGLGEGDQNRLLSAEGALVRFHLPRLLFTGYFSPRSIIIEDASLFCPALVSPTGEVALLLSDFSIDLRRNASEWNVNTFRAEILGVRILADGTIPRPWLKAFAHELSLENAKENPNDQRTFLQHYGDAAHALLERQPLLAELKSPSIFLRFAPLGQALTNAASRQTDRAAAAPTAPDAPQLPFATDNDDEHLLVTLSLAAQGYHSESLDLETGASLLRAVLVFDHEILPYVIGTPYASLEHFKWNKYVEAERMILQLPRPSPTVRSLQGIFDTPLDSLRFSAWKITASGFPFDLARMRILSANGEDLLQAENYLLHASVASGWNYLGAFAQMNRTSRSGQIDFIADWNTDYLSNVPADKLPSLLQGQATAGLQAPLHAAGHLILGDNLHPTWAAAHMRIGNFKYDELSVSYAHARAHWNGIIVSVDEAVIHSPEGYNAELTYWQDLHNDRYRVQAKGTINPLALTPVIGEPWWPQLWGDFDFSKEHWPSASFAMVGIHGMGTVGKQIFVQAQIENAAYRKMPIVLADAMVFMNGNRVDLYDFEVSTERGHASVHLQWMWSADSQLREYLAFAAAGTLPISEATLFVGPGTAEATQNIRSGIPPRASMVGVLLGDQTQDIGEEIYMKLYADFPSTLSTEWANFDTVRAHMLMTPTTRVFPDIEATFAGGELTASIHIDLPEPNTTRFKADIDLKNGHINRLEAALPMLQKAEQQMDEAYPETTQTGAELALPRNRLGGIGTGALPQAAEVTTAATEQPTIASETQSLLDQPGLVVFKGFIEGNAGQMRSINGAGKLSLFDATLGQIHILGPISRLLQFIGMPLATLKFDQADTHWNVKDGIINFPNLTVSGQTGMLKANGNIDLETNNLNFIVYLHPFGEVTVPILSQALDLFSPLSNILSVRITGSLAMPQAQTNVRPGGIFRGRESIRPHDMEVPTEPDESAEIPRKLRRPGIIGPR